MKMLNRMLLTILMAVASATVTSAQSRDTLGWYAAAETEAGSTGAQGVDSGDTRSRGLGDRFKSQPFKQLQPISGPPARLCHAETVQMTQCKCFTQTECQALTALFPNACPSGSTQCEFLPMSRGPMPSLPQNLCHYQVPMSITECSCNNAVDCQLLAPFCPGACPVGSTSCTCRPMRRGN